MPEEIRMDIKDFARLSIEKRAKMVLEDMLGCNKIILTGTKSLLDYRPLHEAHSYLEENKHIELVGGTPKSGARYAITDEGIKFRIS